jgi:gliding motility-associated-like protein
VNDTVWVRVTNTATVTQCSAVATIDIIVELLPEPVIDAESNKLCYDFGNTAPNAALELRVTGLTGTGHTFQWYLGGNPIPGATGATYDAVEPGDYTVQVNGPAPRNCPSNMSAVFPVIKSGIAEIPEGTTGYSVTGAFSDNQTITVNIRGYGSYEYMLDEGEWQDSNIFSNIPFSSEPHKVTVRDKNGCGEIVINDVYFIDYPRYFTPNGDYYHERWNIAGLGDDPQNTKIYIFDRYGKLVKQISSAGDGWDGTMNGNPLPADDYWFTVTFRETVNGVPVTREFKAHFTLKR